MKLSLNSVKPYLSFDLPPLSELEDKIGSQLGGIEEVTMLGDIYDGAVVVRVVDCQKLEDSDHLNVCKVDDGKQVEGLERDDQGLVQVVCGAPNVRAGLNAAWLPPGVTVPETLHKDPFVLEARMLRGVKSNGMLASPRELALGDNHDGLFELDDSLSPGTPLAEALGLDNEVIIDIENKMFTHRPDCFGSLGLARELAGIQAKPFTSPEWFSLQPSINSLVSNTLLPLKIVNELANLVPRFSAVTIANVKVEASPMWLQIELLKIGQKPIGNIVDLTNYYMHLTGQPLHAYDYDKVKTLSSASEPSLVIRNPKPDEQLKLINGKTIQPRSEAIVIATDKQAIGLAGAMGGQETEVSSETTNLILECANFDMYSIRRTSMYHGLFSDAVTRFNKGQSPLQTMAVLVKVSEEVLKLAGGSLASEFLDDNQLGQVVMDRGSLHPSVSIDIKFINDQLGLQIEASEAAELLKNVEFKVEQSDNQLTVSAPFWRTDIEQREDVVEEVGRLYGLNRVPLVLPKRDISPISPDLNLEAKKQIRSSLSKAGANEVLTYSFVHSNLLENSGQDKTKAYALSNALSPSLQYYRLSLIPSLLDKVHSNIKAGYDQFAIFEIGKGHSLDNGLDEEGLPKEENLTSLVLASADKLKLPASAYYQAKQFLECLVEASELVYEPISEPLVSQAIAKPYALSRAAAVKLRDGRLLGVIGEFKPSVSKSFKLPRYSAGFELDNSVLTTVLDKTINYQQLSRFPSVKQDITLAVSRDVAFSRVAELIAKQTKQLAPQASVTSLEAVSIYEDETKTDTKNLTFRLEVTNELRTLTDQEVNKLLDEVAAVADHELGAKRV